MADRDRNRIPRGFVSREQLHVIQKTYGAKRDGFGKKESKLVHVELDDRDWHLVRFIGAGWMAHGVRRALAEFALRCCACPCCRRVQLEQPMDLEARMRWAYAKLLDQ